MTKIELMYLKEVLTHIKDPDQHIAKALAYVNKDLAQIEARRGQLKDMYEVDMVDGRPW